MEGTQGVTPLKKFKIEPPIDCEDFGFDDWNMSVVGINLYEGLGPYAGNYNLVCDTASDIGFRNNFSIMLPRDLILVVKEREIPEWITRPVR